MSLRQWIYNRTRYAIYSAIATLLSDIILHVYFVSRGTETLGYDHFQFMEMMIHGRYMMACIIVLSMFIAPLIGVYCGETYGND